MKKNVQNKIYKSIPNLGLSVWIDLMCINIACSMSFVVKMLKIAS